MTTKDVDVVVVPWSLFCKGYVARLGYRYGSDQQRGMEGGGGGRRRRDRTSKGTDKRNWIVNLINIHTYFLTPLLDAI